MQTQHTEQSQGTEGTPPPKRQKGDVDLGCVDGGKIDGPTNGPAGDWPRIGAVVGIQYTEGVYRGVVKARRYRKKVLEVSVNFPIDNDTLWCKMDEVTAAPDSDFVKK